MDKPTLKEISQLVSFTRTALGTLEVKNVYGDVWGDVMGEVWGDVKGTVWGNIEGDVVGNIEGAVKGKIN